MESMGVASGCVYFFVCVYLFFFLAASCSFLKCFLLVLVLFVIIFYVLNHFFIFCAV